MKYDVAIIYEGAIRTQVEAKDKNEAKQKAEKILNEITPEELTNNLIEIYVDGVQEVR